LPTIKEPILCCPNEPDHAKFLSDVAGTKIDEAFIGSCMTNIGHFRAAAKLGHIPTVADYFDAMGIVNKDNAAIYKYLNFNQIKDCVDNTKGVTA
jgi:aconitase B